MGLDRISKRAVEAGHECAFLQALVLELHQRRTATLDRMEAVGAVSGTDPHYLFALGGRSRALAEVIDLIEKTEGIEDGE